MLEPVEDRDGTAGVGWLGRTDGLGLDGDGLGENDLCRVAIRSASESRREPIDKDGVLGWRLGIEKLLRGADDGLMLLGICGLGRDWMDGEIDERLGIEIPLELLRPIDDMEGIEPDTDERALDERLGIEIPLENELRLLLLGLMDDLDGAERNGDDRGPVGATLLAVGCEGCLLELRRLSAAASIDEAISRASAIATAVVAALGSGFSVTTNIAISFPRPAPHAGRAEQPFRPAPNCPAGLCDH